MQWFLPLSFLWLTTYARSVMYDVPFNTTQKWFLGDTIRFDLPMNRSATGIIENVQEYSPESVFISGHVMPLPQTDLIGTFAAAFYKGVMNANIHYSGDVQYELRPLINSGGMDLINKRYGMNEVNMTETYYGIDKEKGEVERSPPYPFREKNIRLVGTTVLRILVLYTKEASQTAGDENSLLATITMAIGNFNLALQNSLVDISVEYVAERIQEYDTYIEDPDMGVMLGQLGYELNIDRRIILRCHAVHLVTKNTQYCGISDYNFDGLSSGFSASFLGCIGGYFTLAHEVGHNVGLHHDQSGYGGVGSNRGYCWDDATGNRNCHRSVMAYPGCVTPLGRTNCDRVKYFSTPQVYEMGNAIGVARYCDNAQQWRNNIQRFMNQMEVKFTSPPTIQPSTIQPSTIQPSLFPSIKPTFKRPISAVYRPSAVPRSAPTVAPSWTPTMNPSLTPTANPSLTPTMNPTSKPTVAPSSKPTMNPTQKPSVDPSSKPTANPTQKPTVAPTSKPTANPTSKPTVAPTSNPTANPTQKPIAVHSSSSASINQQDTILYVLVGIVSVILVCVVCIVVYMCYFKMERSSRNGLKESASISLKDIYSSMSGKSKKRNEGSMKHLKYSLMESSNKQYVNYNSEFKYEPEEEEQIHQVYISPRHGTHR